MSKAHLDRVREDLATVKAAMGGLAYGRADVWFFAPGSAAAACFATSHALGARSGFAFWAAVLPVAGVAAAYAWYMTMNARRSSPLRPERRHEYRASLAAIPLAVIASLALRKWAGLAGMTHLQFGGALAVVAGMGFLTAGALNMTPRRYPRSVWWAMGLPLTVVGVVAPFCTESAALTAAGVMAAVMFALLAAALHFELKRSGESVR